MNQLRVLHPADGIIAFYAGRDDGFRYADEPNWVDRGALQLGIASYAVVSGDQALVYDTHVSVEHARFIRGTLERQGVRAFTVVLSHWHLDHVAGNAVFADADIIANERTAEHLREHKPEIEAGTLEGPPAIDPLVLPTRVFADRLPLDIGHLRVELIRTNIHSDDATVVWLPEQRLLLCGDTMEDPLTYVTEPESLDVHLAELETLRSLGPDRILPNHGDPDLIAGGGYAPALIEATRQYIQVLQRSRHDPDVRHARLHDLIAGPLAAGWVRFFAPYEDVHLANLERVLVAQEPPTR